MFDDLLKIRGSMQLFKSNPRYWLKNNNGPMNKQQLTTMDPSPQTAELCVVDRSNERGSKELRDILKRVFLSLNNVLKNK